jgi:uncharacterized membrane protein YjjP (DUF1212 family)
MANITYPVFIFGSLIAGLVGSLIHLIFGGKPLRLLLSILFSWIGFWVGNNLGFRYGINFFQYGPIYFGTAVMVSLVLGLIGYWISGENQKPSIM